MSTAAAGTVEQAEEIFSTLTSPFDSTNELALQLDIPLAIATNYRITAEHLARNGYHIADGDTFPWLSRLQFEACPLEADGETRIVEILFNQNGEVCGITSFDPIAQIGLELLTLLDGVRQL